CPWGGSLLWSRGRAPGVVVVAAVGRTEQCPVDRIGVGGVEPGVGQRVELDDDDLVALGVQRQVDAHGAVEPGGDGHSGEEVPRHQGGALHHGRVELGGDLVAAAFAQTVVEAGAYVRARVRSVLLDAAGGGDDPTVHDEEPVLVGHGDPVLDEQGPSPAGQA